MKKIFRIITLGLLGFLFLNSCVDRDFDEPEFPFTDPEIVTNTTIKALKSKHVLGSFTMLEEELTFSAVVIANDSTGNFYKKIVVQDSTGGIEVLVDGRDLFSKFPVGRRVFIKAEGLVIGDYNNLIQLGLAVSEGSLAAIPYKTLDNYIVGGSLNNFIEPKVLKINEINEDDISTLIKFYDVQFSNTYLGSTFADGINKTDANRTLVDCSKKEFLVRSSGYAKFAIDTLPSLNGELTCVLGIYRSDFQGFIRSLKDINFTNERCGTSTGNETLVTIKSLRDLYTSGQTTMPDKIKIKGIVISDRNNLNTDTKNAIIQDATAGVVVRFDANHSFNLNDEIEVAVSKLELSEYSKLLQFNNTPIDLAKKTGSSTVTPIEVPISTILSSGEIYESRLVLIKGASISGGSVYKDFNIYVDDGTGSLNLYTRTVASFANQSLPTNSVDIQGIIGQYNDKYQMSIRNLEDVSGGGTNPTTDIFKDDFETGLGKWNAVSVKGDQVWTLDATHGNPGACAKMSGFAGSSNENEDWLISPKIDLTTVSTGALYFDNAKNYTGNDLEVYISKDYSGSGSPSSATWTKLTFVKSAGSWNYVSSGKIDLSGYNGYNVYISFKYTSTASDSSTWEIDNVKVTK